MTTPIEPAGQTSPIGPTPTEPTPTDPNPVVPTPVEQTTPIEPIQEPPMNAAQDQTDATPTEPTIEPTAEHTTEPTTEQTARGPASATIVVGILCLLTALAVGLGGALGLRLNVAAAGPALIIGAGLLLVVLGFLGLRSDRRTR